MKKMLFTLLGAMLAMFVLPMQTAHAAASAKREVDCMASAIFYEAQGESQKGKIAVANVILNRMRSGLYPKTVCGVIYQRGQFQWVYNHYLRKSRVYKQSRHKNIYNLANNIYSQHKLGKQQDITKGALFFSANGVRPAPRAIKGVKIGRHQFFNLRGFTFKS